MSDSYSESYKQAGVDVTAGYESTNLIKPMAERTKIKGVMGSLGAFGAMFDLKAAGFSDPILVSGTDGVGTKLLLAHMADKHDTIGIDCVAMCVNDIVCSGAKPLYFLDYLALGKNTPLRTAEIVSGVAKGCKLSSCALVGGETAEMPGFYAVDDYDLAGFAVGAVERDKLVEPNAQEGDVIIGLASSGVHSNGFSLVRKIFFTEENNAYNEFYEELGTTLLEALLEPTRIYVNSVLKLIDSCKVHSLCHITGGGFYENIPRALSDNTRAVINKANLEILPIFELIQNVGKIPEHDMFNTFNMGTGFIAIVPESESTKAIEVLTNCGEKATIIGKVIKGEKGVDII